MICGLELPVFEGLIKFLRINPTVKELIIKQDQWDQAFDEYSDYLHAMFGRTIESVPWVADGHGFPAFMLRGKKIIGAIL